MPAVEFKDVNIIFGNACGSSTFQRSWLLVAPKDSAAHRPWLWTALRPVLDLMQTIPTLAYLLPILVLFGIGPMVAVVASAIYAIPPMVRAVVPFSQGAS